MDNWIIGNIRRVCWHQIFIGAGVALIFACLGFSQSRYILNFAQGPYSLNAQELGAIENVDSTPRYFVSVAGSKAMATGIQEVTERVTVDRRNGRQKTEKKANFYALVIDNRLLICKSGAVPKTSYTGVLASIPSEVSERLNKEPEFLAHKDKFFPFYLMEVDENWFRFPGFIAIVGIVALAFILFKQALNFFAALKYVSNPFSHPVVKRVEEWGDLDQIAENVRSEAASPVFTAGFGRLVCQKYLVTSSFFTFDVHRLEDLLWAYKEKNKLAYKAIFLFCSGNKSIEAGGLLIDQLLAFVVTKTPWALFGFTEERSNLIKKISLEQLTELVADRKGEWNKIASSQTVAKSNKPIVFEKQMDQFQLQEGNKQKCYTCKGLVSRKEGKMKKLLEGSRFICRKCLRTWWLYRILGIALIPITILIVWIFLRD